MADLSLSSTDAGDGSEITPKNPDLNLAALRYSLAVSERIGAPTDEIKQRLLEGVQLYNMAPFYSQLCQQFKWPVDSALLESMTQKNDETLAQFHDKLKSAEETEGESEVREALLATAEHYTRVGEQAKAELAFRKTADKTVSLGQRLDLAFSLIRVGFFHGDVDLVVRNIDKAKSLLEGGGDWDRRNKLKVYEAVYFLSVRNFKKAAELFLDTLSTFTSYELFDYHTFIFYTVVTSIVSLDRPHLREKVIDAPEILAVIAEIPHLGSCLNSFYNSEYKEFFVSLGHIADRVKLDWLIGPHTRYFVREMRILAYAQLLESYQSVQLGSMAQAFGVSTDFLDLELSRFIAAGRLHCKIDKVGGIVETNRPDKKNAQYQATIRQGDLLLNRIQKLSRVINV